MLPPLWNVLLAASASLIFKVIEDLASPWPFFFTIDCLFLAMLLGDISLFPVKA
jgi:hypothetical protein